MLSRTSLNEKELLNSGLSDMGKKKMITRYFFFITVNIDNYHNKCQIFIFFKFKGRF